MCEILSPGTLRIDRMKKMPIYARERVPQVWLVDPHEKTVEVFRMAESSNTLVGTFGGGDALQVSPSTRLPFRPRSYGRIRGSRNSQNAGLGGRSRI